MATPTYVHECPGVGCDASVPNSMVACGRCWRRLPKPYRDAIWRGIRDRDAGAHGDALAAAYGWYERNPLPGRVDKPEEPRLF